MTLVSAPYWPVALVLAQLAGQGEWPLGAIKVSGVITLCAARGVTGGLLRSVQLSSHEVLFRVDRLRLFCSQVSRRMLREIGERNLLPVAEPSR